MADSTALQELEDLASDAMGDVHDMDTTIRDFARAAAQAIWTEASEVINGDLKRISAMIGPKAVVYLGISNDRALERRVAATIYPHGMSGPGSHLVLAPSIPEALTAAEDWAADYACAHRVMTADDIGVAA